MKLSETEIMLAFYRPLSLEYTYTYPNEVVKFPENDYCANSVSCGGMWSWYWNGPPPSSDGYTEYVHDVEHPAPIS